MDRKIVSYHYLFFGLSARRTRSFCRNFTIGTKTNDPLSYVYKLNVMKKKDLNYETDNAILILKCIASKKFILEHSQS